MTPPPTPPRARLARETSPRRCERRDRRAAAGAPLARRAAPAPSARCRRATRSMPQASVRAWLSAAESAPMSWLGSGARGQPLSASARAPSLPPSTRAGFADHDLRRRPSPLPMTMTYAHDHDVRRRPSPAPAPSDRLAARRAALPGQRRRCPASHRARCAAHAAEPPRPGRQARPRSIRHRLLRSYRSEMPIWFPSEPIRSLDAIHLATAVLARSLVPDLTVLSLDERVRRSAEQMGFRVLPAGTT